MCSEFLQDLHPDLSPPFPKGVIKDEIAVAYGRRGIIKLIDVLRLPAMELTHEQRSHALRVLNGLLSTQEQKTDAINEDAATALTQLIDAECQDGEVLRLSCEALESLAQVHQGRQAIAMAEGVSALTNTLRTSPEAAAGALRRFASSNDGVALLSQALEPVVPALVALIDQPMQDGISCRACENAAATLAGLASTDEGIMSCLKHKVPRCIVELIDRGLSGDFKFDKGLMSCLEQCSSCLEQMAHHPYGKTAIREANGVRALGAVLEIAQWHRDTLRQASAALMSVSIEKESKVQIVQLAARPLVRLLKGSDQQLVTNARAALVSACEHLEARRGLGPFLMEDEQKELLFQGPLPPAPPDFRYQVVLPYGPDDTKVS